MKFVIKERAYLSTQAFTQSTDPPEQVLKICADPIGSIIDSSGYASSLAVTISRFREFRYLGTRVGIRPAATIGQIDPAHISASDTGSNYMHPRDVANVLSYRRWSGQNIDLPYVAPTGTTKDGDAVVYTESDALRLDLAWMADQRFMHCNVAEGFDLFVQPLRVEATLPSVAAGALWAYRTYSSVATPTAQTAMYRPEGMTALAPGRVIEDDWTPNPFAILKYKLPDGVSSINPSNTKYEICGYNNGGRWYCDCINLGASAGSVTLDVLLRLIRERYYAPIAIIRIPPSYGSVFYYTAYFAHYFAVRKPYLQNSEWKCIDISPVVPPVDGSPYMVRAETLYDRSNGIEVYRAVSPDPFTAEDNGRILAMNDDIFSNGIYQYSQDPSDGLEDLEAFNKVWESIDNDSPATVEDPDLGALSHRSPPSGGAASEATPGGMKEDE